MVGNTGVRFSVVDGERERRASIVTEVIRDEVIEHRVSFNSILCGVQVLQERESKALADLVPDGEEEQTATILAQLAHGGRLRHGCRKQEVGFSFSLFRIEQADWVALLERINSALDMGFHVSRFRLTFMKSRMHSLLKIARGGQISGQPTERDYHVMSLGSVSGEGTNVS